MTVDLTIAHCPRCGNVESVYVRDGDDLVCQSCRGCCDGLAPVELASTHSLHSLPPDAALSAGRDDGPVPPPTMPGRRLLRRVY